LHARFGAGRRSDVIIVDRRIDQCGFDEIASAGKFFGAAARTKNKRQHEVGRPRGHPKALALVLKFTPKLQHKSLRAM
jgi:hypothetical protein